MSDEDYVAVQVRIMGATDAAVLLVADRPNPATPAWIPHQHIHSEDVARARTARLGQRGTLRVKDWKARETGLAATTDPTGATRDLFGKRP